MLRARLLVIWFGLRPATKRAAGPRRAGGRRVRPCRDGGRRPRRRPRAPSRRRGRTRPDPGSDRPGCSARRRSGWRRSSTSTSSAPLRSCASGCIRTRDDVRSPRSHVLHRLRPPCARQVAQDAHETAAPVGGAPTPSAMDRPGSWPTRHSRAASRPGARPPRPSSGRDWPQRRREPRSSWPPSAGDGGASMPRVRGAARHGAGGAREQNRGDRSRAR